MYCNLLLNHRGIHFPIDFFLHHSGKLWIADQLYNDFRHSIVQQFFVDLLFIITLMTSCHGAVFTAIVEEILVLCTVSFMLDAFIAVHPGSANRAFHNTGQQMDLTIFAMIDFFIFFRLCQ